MPEETVDTVVSTRTNSGGGPAARSVMSETVDTVTGHTTTTRGGGVEHEEIAEGGKPSRLRMKESTIKLLDALEKPAPAASEEGDPDDDAPDATDVVDNDANDPDDVDDTDDEGKPSDDADDNAATETAEQLAIVKEWQSKATRLEESNRALMAEVELAKKTPARDRTDREKTLVEADQAYIEEGSIPALRKFLSVVVGAAPDSKEVDAELAGLYADLTEKELNVPFDEKQKAIREAARAKLQLARDKRDRKAETETKSAANSGEAQQIEAGTKYVDNVLTTKAQGGTSLAEEYPLLMSLAKDLDGYSPAEVIARAVKQEIMVGTLDPRGDSVEMVRTVARKIEAYYDGLTKKIAEARSKKPTDTTKSGKAAADKASKEQRQSHGTRTITNATASVAPATSPKKKHTAKPTTEEKPKFKSKKEAQDYALRHIPG